MSTNLSDFMKSEIEKQPLINNFNDTQIRVHDKSAQTKSSDDNLNLLYPTNFKYVLKLFDTVAVLMTLGMVYINTAIHTLHSVHTIGCMIHSAHGYAVFDCYLSYISSNLSS